MKKAIPTTEAAKAQDAQQNAQWHRRYLRMRQKGVTRNNSLLGTHATMRTRICKKERSYLIGSFSSCILSILSDMQSADFFSNNLDKIKSWAEQTPYWGEKRRRCILFFASISSIYSLSYPPPSYSLIASISIMNNIISTCFLILYIQQDLHLSKF